MANDAETTITLTDAPEADAVEVIGSGLRAYNEAQAGYSDWRPLAILVRDQQTEAVFGGLLGRTRAVLSTVHFQAPGFYLKQGWEVAASIDC